MPEGAQRAGSGFSKRVYKKKTTQSSHGMVRMKSFPKRVQIFSFSEFQGVGKYDIQGGSDKSGTLSMLHNRNKK
jgi:hypothetical protein